MAMFDFIVNPSINTTAYLEHVQGQPAPSIPISTLRSLADCIPTSILSGTAHSCINLAGDLLAGNSNLRDGHLYGKWKQARIKQLLIEVEQATSLEQYEACTSELDVLQGHEQWKATDSSIEPAYHPEAIKAHLRKLEHAANQGDVDSMILQLRTTLSRDLGGMSDVRLYGHSWFGTKELIDDYIETVTGTIERFLELTAESDSSGHEARHHLQSLEDALKYFGRSALTLSGGAVLGMKHVGVVKALWEADLLPEIISGASAGAIVAGIVGTCTDEEMVQNLEQFPNADLAVFDPPGTGVAGWLIQRLRTVYCQGSPFDKSHLERVMRTWCKDITFKEAYYKTRRVLNITVSAPEESESRLLNYMTAPDVYIWSAICASCSVPAFFHPATIFEKDPISKRPVVWMQDSQRTFLDGSLDIDIPTRKLSEMFNVNFLIVSQVNPHIRVFLESEEHFAGVQPKEPSRRRSTHRVLLGLLRRELVYRAQRLADAGFPWVMHRGASVLSQQYTGNINILPHIDIVDYLRLLMNPTAAFMRRAVLQGERSTWPKICRIKNSVEIELKLLRAIAELRARVNFSPEARATREEVRNSLRGRAGARSNILRRRSLSGDRSTPKLALSSSDDPSPPSPTELRKANSSGSLVEKIGGFTSTLPEIKRVISPQAGISDGTEHDRLEDGLLMTLRTQTDHDTTQRSAWLRTRPR